MRKLTEKAHISPVLTIEFDSEDELDYFKSKWPNEGDIDDFSDSGYFCIEVHGDRDEGFLDRVLDILDEIGTNGGLLNEKIVKKGNKWQVQSEKGRNMGTYDTKKEAEKRLDQIEYFKHVNEGMMTDDEIRNNLHAFWDLDFRPDKYHEAEAQKLVRQYLMLEPKMHEFKRNDIDCSIIRKESLDEYGIQEKRCVEKTNDLVLVVREGKSFNKYINLYKSNGTSAELDDTTDEFEDEFRDHIRDYLAIGMNRGTYFGIEDLSKEELQYIQKEASETNRPLYRFESSNRVSKIGDTIDMYPMRSFTATKAGMNYIAKTFDFDSEDTNTLYQTQGKTLYYDLRWLTQDDEDLGGEEEVFVWGRFKVVDISEISLNKRVFKLVTIEQIYNKLNESLKHFDESLTSIVTGLTSQLAAAGINFNDIRLSPHKDYILFKTALDNEYAISIKSLAATTSVDYKKIRYSSDGEIKDGEVYDDNNIYKGKAYVGIPITRAHNNYDPDITVYTWVENHALKAFLDFPTFLSGIVNGRY